MKNYIACRVNRIDNGSVMQIKIACLFQESHIVPRGPVFRNSSLSDKTKLCFPSPYDLSGRWDIKHKLTCRFVCLL